MVLAGRHKRSRRQTAQATLLLVVTAWSCTCAEAFQVPQLPFLRALRRAGAYVPNEDDNEWYSPPPPAPTPPSALKPGRGQCVLQTNLKTEHELHEFLNSGDERLTIVKFHASWCKSCAKFTMKLDKLAADYADWVLANRHDLVVKSGDVRIVNIEYSAARELCNKLSVTRLPTVHMYVSKSGAAEKVQDFPCPPSKFHEVERLLKGYLNTQRKIAAAKCDDDLKVNLDQGRELIRKQFDSKQEEATGLMPIADTSFDVASGTHPKRRFWDRLSRNNSYGI